MSERASKDSRVLRLVPVADDSAVINITAASRTCIPFMGLDLDDCEGREDVHIKRPTLTLEFSMAADNMKKDNMMNEKAKCDHAKYIRLFFFLL